MRKTLILVLFPVAIVLLSVRLAFTEFFVEWEYSKEDFPKDRWGLSNEVRLQIAKLGLRAVLSDSGMKEFKASGLFENREIKHMQDVKRLLSFLFFLLYALIPVISILLLSLRSVRRIGWMLLLSSLIVDGIGIFFILLSFVDYDWLFTTFHDYVFGPYSWRFRDTDMLLRVYPMKFWFDATVFTLLLTFVIAGIFQILGFLLLVIHRSRR